MASIHPTGRRAWSALLTIAFAFGLCGAATGVRAQTPAADDGASSGGMRVSSRTMPLFDAAASSALVEAAPFHYPQDHRTHRVAGAIAGFAVGAGVTWVVLHQGGSTSKCDRSANQDALNSGECAGLVVLGGLAGAGIGAIVGGFFRSERSEGAPLERFRVGVVPGRAPVVRLAIAW